MQNDFKVGDYAKLVLRVPGVKLAMGKPYQVVKVYNTTVRLRDYNQDWTIPFAAIEKVELEAERC
ncbi:hypothetical protein HCA63_06500 [Listeria booriae]|uniref:hypothetical protein n=1 Tax=Listeria booriae TaxID=1552123 RepID=UPI0016284797|nr:hypothetical protein [Listeria booriae]MBC1888000.1 hypothetical protein [Listeria booriae]